jgi:hypothetical protein
VAVKGGVCGVWLGVAGVLFLDGRRRNLFDWHGRWLFPMGDGKTGKVETGEGV